MLKNYSTAILKFILIDKRKNDLQSHSVFKLLFSKKKLIVVKQRLQA